MGKNKTLSFLLVTQVVVELHYVEMYFEYFLFIL